MKLKLKYIKLFGLATLVIVVTLSCMIISCADNVTNMPSEPKNEIRVSLSFSDFQNIPLITRDITSTSKIIAAFYDSEQNFISKVDLSLSYDNNGSLNGNLPIIPSANYVHFICDYNFDGTQKPDEIILNSFDEKILWGLYEITETTDAINVTLIHPYSKIVVSTNLDDFEIKGFAIYGVNDIGTLAPSNWTVNPDSPTIPENASPSSPILNDEQLSSDEISVFETDNTYDSVRVIIKGKYNGKDCYYPISLKNREDYIDIIRNHCYKINVTEVNSEGWTTLAEAVAAQPENRMTVEITDNHTEIKDIIACKDYALGVSSIEAVLSQGANSVLTIISSYDPDNDSNADRIQVTTNDTWIELPQNYNASGTKQEDNFYKYDLTLKIDPILEETPTRIGTITVKSGDLKREVKITQYSKEDEEKLASRYRIYWTSNFGAKISLSGVFNSVLISEVLSIPRIPELNYIEFKSIYRDGNFGFKISDNDELNPLEKTDISIQSAFTPIKTSSGLLYVCFITDNEQDQVEILPQFPYGFQLYDDLKIEWLRNSRINDHTYRMDYVTYWFDDRESDKKTRPSAGSDNNGYLYHYDAVRFFNAVGTTTVNIFFSSSNYGEGDRTPVYTYHISELSYTEWDSEPGAIYWSVKIDSWEIE